MKNGMKQTVNREIPVDWEVGKLEDISDFITKGSTPTTYGYDWVKEGIVFLRSECVGMHGFTLSGAMHISDEAHHTMGRSIIKSGDILMTITGNVGRVCVLPQSISEANINQHIARVRINNDDVDSQFVYQFLSQENIVKEYSKITTGQAYPQLSLKQVRETYIPLPPLPEQQKIAEILSTVDEKMAVMDEQLAQTQELKKGLMQRLLTKGIGHTAFKESPLGEIPENWEAVNIGQYCKLQNGYAFKSEAFTTAGTPVIRISNVQDGIVTVGSNNVYYDGLAISPSFKVCYGEALIAMSGATTGKIGRYTLQTHGYINQRVGKFVVNNKSSLDYGFLFQVLHSENFVNQLSASLTAGAQPNISSKQIEEILMQLPPISEQRQIAEILSTIDDKLQVLTDKKAQYQELKRGLMQQLLTGQRRVRVAAEAATA